MKLLSFLIFIVFSLSAQTTPKLRLIFETENQFDPRLASGGSITSVGGGDTSDLSQLSAWFYNNDEIRTCMSYNKNFGVSEREVEFQITRALSTWQTYFSENRINDFIDENISTNFVFSKDCDGSEDLILYFGTGPIYENLLDAKAVQKLNKPIAYVNKTHISENLSWSKGYIRFIESSRYNKVSRNNPAYPDWSIQGSLYKFILHEIGHVLGFEHKPGTIMDENISYSLFISRNFSPTTIDDVEDLFETKRKIKKYIPFEILDNNIFSSALNNQTPNFILNNKFDGTIEVELDFPESTSQYYSSSSVISVDENIPLYTNFQNERGIFQKTKAAYFKINNSIFSFSFEGNQTTLLIDGIKAAIYQEEI